MYQIACFDLQPVDPGEVFQDAAGEGEDQVDVDVGVVFNASVIKGKQTLVYVAPTDSSIRTCMQTPPCLKAVLLHSVVPCQLLGWLPAATAVCPWLSQMFSAMRPSFPGGTFEPKRCWSQYACITLSCSKSLCIYLDMSASSISQVFAQIFNYVLQI